MARECGNLVPARGGCWCWEHLRHCDDLECEHGAHYCEAPVHFCDEHKHLAVDE